MKKILMFTPYMMDGILLIASGLPKILKDKGEIFVWKVSDDKFWTLDNAKKVFPYLNYIENIGNIKELDKYNFDLLITGRIQDEYGIQLCRDGKYKKMYLQEGFGCRTHTDLGSLEYFDRFCMWGEFEKEFFKHAYPFLNLSKDRYNCMGSLKYQEDFFDKSKTNNPFKTDKKKIAVFLHLYNLDNIKGLIEKMGEKYEVIVVTKGGRPDDTEYEFYKHNHTVSIYYNLAFDYKYFNNGNIYAIRDYIINADEILVDYSTCILECLLLGKNPIILDISAEERELAHGGYFFVKNNMDRLRVFEHSKNIWDMILDGKIGQSSELDLNRFVVRDNFMQRLENEIKGLLQ